MVPTYIAPDALERSLLLNYRPSWMASSPGADPQAARAQMALSRYDHNGDWKSDAPGCKHLFLTEARGNLIDSPDLSPEDALLKRGLATIGVEGLTPLWLSPNL